MCSVFKDPWFPYVEMQTDLVLQQAKLLFLHMIKHWCVSEGKVKNSCVSPLLSTHAVPISKSARHLLSLVYHVHSDFSSSRAKK